MDEGTFGDTAGAIPSNGVVVRDLRTRIVARPRGLTSKTILSAATEFLVFRTASNDWWFVVIERAGSGEWLAERQFSSRSKALRARARFVRRVEEMPGSNLAEADWGTLLAQS
ncbi:MAG: hypothetical protein U0P45_09055 [Acidimicrobiales bacterium]